MLFAHDEKGKQTHIEDSSGGREYTCIICGSEVSRAYGVVRHYFRHKVGSSTECRLKLQKMLVKVKDEVEDIGIIPTKYVQELYGNVWNKDAPDSFDELVSEQEAVINSDEKRIKVEARAGSGKTHTIQGFMKKREDVEKLYLVFNREMRDEALERFKNIKGLTVKTLYSLAYSKVGYKYKNRLRNELNQFDYAKSMELFAKDAEDFQLVEEMSVLYKQWLSCPYDTIDEFCLEREVKSTKEYYLKLIWKNITDKNSSLSVDHATYMKLWQLSKPDLSDMCDILAVDECLIGEHLVDTDIGKVNIKKLYDMYNSKENIPLAKSYNIKNNKYEYKEIVWAMKSKNRKVYKVKCTNSDYIIGTPNHKVLTKRGYIQIRNLIPYKDIILMDNNDGQNYVKCVDYYGIKDTYDIEVKDNHNFITSLSKVSTGIISSNCQDTSEAFATAIKHCNVDTMLYCYDMSQEIYQFCNEYSGAPLLDGEKYGITYSVRIGNTLSKISSMMYELFSGKPFSFIGLNKEQKIIKQVDTNNRHMVICRSNLGIITRAIEVVEKGKTFSILGNKELNFNTSLIERIYNFKYKISQHFTLKRFQNYDHMKSVLNINKEFDADLRSAVGVVEKFGDSTMNKLEALKNNIRNVEDADVIYATCHKCKGKTFTLPTIVADDFVDLFDAFTNEDSKFSWEKSKEEINILYVALSREKCEVELPNSVINLYSEIRTRQENGYNMEFGWSAIAGE